MTPRSSFQERQVILLSDSCEFGHVVHEIGHALGLQHEHARRDRNKFVKIINENIENGAEGNFGRNPFDFADSGNYCYASIMHYASDAFSKAPPNAKTIIPIQKVEIGQRKALDVCDAQTVARLYAEEIRSRN